MKAYEIDTIINQRRFSTQKSVLIAHDSYQDESGCYERDGRNMFLYRTLASGIYWLVEQKGRGQYECVELDLDGALNAFERLDVHIMQFGEAFPGVEIKTA